MSTQETLGGGKKRKNAMEGEDASRVGSSPPRKYVLRSATSTPVKEPVVVPEKDLPLWTIFERERKRKLRLEEAKKKAPAVNTVRFPPRLLKLSEIPETGKVTTYSKADNLLAIKGILKGTDFYKALVDSPLGTVFEIPVKKAAMSGRLVHNMLCRMLLTRRKHELWFVISNKPFRFSLKEFAALTGLPCGPYPPETEMEKLRRISNSSDAFWNELMVGRLASGVISDIVDLLWANKDLAAERARIPITTKLRLCLVVLIDGVLCPRGPATVKATRLTVEMVKDVKSFLKYPWGRQAFELTLEVCRVGSESNATVDDLLKRLVGQTHICLKGFPVALQLLFYAAVPAFNDLVFADPKEVPIDFANTNLEKIDLNRSFCNKDIIEIDENPETKVIHFVENQYLLDGVDLSWNDEVHDPLVDNIMKKISEEYVFNEENWKECLTDNPAATGGTAVAKKERGRPRKTTKPTRKPVRGKTKRAQTKQPQMDPSKFFLHIPTDLINDFMYTVVTPIWNEKVKRDEKIEAQKAQSDQKFYVDVMNALVANAKAQDIFKNTVELSDSSAGSGEGEASSDSVEHVVRPKDVKGKGKVDEVEGGIHSEDEEMFVETGTGPSGLRQPTFDETPANTKTGKKSGEIELAELMELDQEKEDAGMRDLTHDEPSLGQLVERLCATGTDNVGGVPGSVGAARVEEDTSEVGRKKIVCALQSVDTPKNPRDDKAREKAAVSSPMAARDEQLQLRDEEVEPLAIVMTGAAIDHQQLGFVAVEEWKAKVFFKALDAFVPEQYIVNGMEVPNTIFREIATKGTHVSTNHMELMLALVWRRIRDTLAGKRAVILDTYFMQHLLKDAEKLKQKRAKAFKWHKSLVAIVNGSYAKRTGNTKWMVDVDMVYAPMNWSDNHWVALCIDLVGGIVTVLDCFLGLHSEEEAVKIMGPVLEVLPMLIAEFADRLPAEYEAPNAFVFKRPTKVSQNVPTGHCGPMTVKFIELHGQGMAVDFMTEEMVDNLRLNYAIDVYETFFTKLSS